MSTLGQLIDAYVMAAVRMDDLVQALGRYHYLRPTRNRPFPQVGTWHEVRAAMLEGLVHMDVYVAIAHIRRRITGIDELELPPASDLVETPTRHVERQR